jgi:tetratricopeptide (TPR) repeat protein
VPNQAIFWASIISIAATISLAQLSATAVPKIQLAQNEYNLDEIDPKDGADAYYQRGLFKVTFGGHWQAAIDDFDIALKINPNYAEVYTIRGVSKAALGNKQGAIDDYNLALKIKPNIAEAYLNQGRAKADLGNKQGAIDDYNLALKIDPNLDWAYFDRGNAKADLGDKQGGITDLTKAAKLFRQQNQMYDYNKAMGLIRKLQG